MRLPILFPAFVFFAIACNMASAADPARGKAGLLYRTVGKRSCEIANAKLGDLAHIQSLIDQASRAPLIPGKHIRAQVPPITEAARGRDGSSIILFADSSSVQMRKGPEAHELRELISRFCPKP